MKTNVYQNLANEELRKELYLSEYEFFDGDKYITFNIVDINFLTKKITVAITNLGKITLNTFDILQTLGKKQYFFEYGITFPEVIFINDFRKTRGVYSVC